MPEFEFPTYVLHLADSRNRACIESAIPNTPISVLVVPEHDLGAIPTKAKGLRSVDGASFTVDVVTPMGTQTHEWTWAFLENAVNAYNDR